MFYQLQIRFTGSPHLLVGFTSAHRRLIGNCFGVANTGHFTYKCLIVGIYFRLCAARSQRLALCYAMLRYATLIYATCGAFVATVTPILISAPFSYAQYEIQQVLRSAFLLHFLLCLNKLRYFMENTPSPLPQFF